MQSDSSVVCTVKEGVKDHNSEVEDPEIICFTMYWYQDDSHDDQHCRQIRKNSQFHFILRLA